MTQVNALPAWTNDYRGCPGWGTWERLAMSHYLCRFFDRLGAIQGEIPIIASNDGDAITRARVLFEHRDDHYAFELWYEHRRIVKRTRDEQADQAQVTEA